MIFFCNIGVEFKSSDEEASKIETVDVSPIPTAQNLQPRHVYDFDLLWFKTLTSILLSKNDSVRCEGQGIQVAERDVYLKKPPIKVNNGFTKARHYKHTYFDDDGQEIDESNKVLTASVVMLFLLNSLSNLVCRLTVTLPSYHFCLRTIDLRYRR